MLLGLVDTQSAPFRLARWTYCSSLVSMLSILVQLSCPLLSILSSFQRHLQQPHQQRQQVLGRGCPGTWGGPSMRPDCLFLISTPLRLWGMRISEILKTGYTVMVLR